MTWNEHLYGDNENKGLISQLSQRLGLLKKIARVASKQKLRLIASELFYSKLNYCLPLFANVWGFDHYKDGGTRCHSITKEDIRKLQVLQNQVARLFVDKSTIRDISTKDLL